MDKPHNTSATPGYETRDTNTGAIINFLVILAVVLVVSGLICWGMFKIFSTHAVDQPATDSPFADTRQLPMGPQLQVNPREDWLKFHQGQEDSLQTYSWENRSAGTVRVPIEQAMELLVKKGLPVQNAPQAQPADEKEPTAEGNKK
ncbi:MAG TPA: hypothetical protein VHS29_13145 [Candidatus Acidoferrales bacterium]|jgi:hypothetical protein|nr:hypothetical protein [Candidatus Acidoferrales bacterium]